MELTITKSTTNPLLNRDDLTGHILSSSTPTRSSILEELVETYGVKNIIVTSINTKFGSNKTEFSAKVYKNEEIMKKVERFHVLNKLFGEKKTKLPRRARKDMRKKKYKIWGTEKRNIKKEEKKQARE